MSRAPGKKFRTEYFRVDGEGVQVELRMTSNGLFSGEVDGAHFQRTTLADWRTAVQAHIDKTRRLVWDPVILLTYLQTETNSRWSNHEGEANREEIELGFRAAWIPRGDGSRATLVSVDEETCEIAPLSQRIRERASGFDRSGTAIPFTSDRWRRLLTIAEAIRAVRARIAGVLKDASSLDAISDRALNNTIVRLIVGEL